MPPDAEPGPQPGAPSDIADPGLAEAGRARIGWAQRGMPVLRLIAERYTREQPFAGLTVAACLHVTAETAGLVGALRAGRDALPARAEPGHHHRAPREQDVGGAQHPVEH